MTPKTAPESKPKSAPKPSPTPVKPAIKARRQSAQKSPKKHVILSVLGLLVWTGGALFLVQLLLALVFYAVLGRERLGEPVWTTVANAVIYTVACLVIIGVPVKFLKQQKPTRTELGLKGLPTWTDIGLAPVAFIAYLVLASILIAIFSNFPFFNAEQAQELGYTLVNSFDRIVAFFALCIVAPIAEELIFRGWLYDKLRHKIPGKRLSLVLSMLLVSVLFGLMHGQWNVGVNVFAMSLALCTLREITGTIYSGILLHILKNIVAFVLVYIVGIA